MRTIIIFILLFLSLAANVAFSQVPAKKGNQSDTYWWHKYPTCINNVKSLEATHARLIMQNYVADPTWGPYGQRLEKLFRNNQFRSIKGKGHRWITWIEGFGNTIMYAAAFQQYKDGSFPTYKNDPKVSRLECHHWGWNTNALKRANTIKWIGLHNTVNNEDIAKPLFTREKLGLPAPKYPDGRLALGQLPELEYPVNCRVFDACCSKDINGNLYYSDFSIIKTNIATGKPIVEMEGLHRVAVKSVESKLLRNRKPEEEVFLDRIVLPKDCAAPFWIDYARTSVRAILKEGLDGVWCDNFSPWDNFGNSPIRKAFGDWSVYRFKTYLQKKFTKSELRKMGVKDATSFDIRKYLKQKAIEFGAKNPSDYKCSEWRDLRWLDEPVWNVYKVFKQKVGQEALRNLYNVIKEEAKKAGRPDFAVCGNDIPKFGLGWARDDWLDMVSTELAPGWGLSTGSRGIMLPPLGKMAVDYNAAREHQKGPFSTIWYYLPEKHCNKPGLGKVLMAEAFANGAFIKYGFGKEQTGTPEAHGWWNDFVHENEEKFGRRSPIADVGILFSPDNQLAVFLPNAIAPDFDAQPHAFGYWGFATAMIDAHIPYRTVTDWNVNSKALAGLKTFIIPNAEYLDDRIIPILKKWVSHGGRLIITGNSGMREGVEGYFKKRKNSVLAPLIGLDMLREDLSKQKNQKSVATDLKLIPMAAVGIDSLQPVKSKKRNKNIKTNNLVHIQKLGKGTVIWSPETLGMDYFINENERITILNSIVDLAGPSKLLSAPNLNSTVGIFCWKSIDGKNLFADLVNYNIDLETDTLTPATNIVFKLRVPKNYAVLHSKTLSPEKIPPAEVKSKKNYVYVRLPELLHFASIKIHFAETP